MLPTPAPTQGHPPALILTTLATPQCPHLSMPFTHKTCPLFLPLLACPTYFQATPCPQIPLFNHRP